MIISRERFLTGILAHRSRRTFNEEGQSRGGWIGNYAEGRELKWGNGKGSVDRAFVISIRRFDDDRRAKDRKDLTLGTYPFGEFCASPRWL